MPDPFKYSLPVFKSPTSVQLLPSHDSLTALFGTPPKANPDVELLPAPATPSLPVFKSPTSVQEVPFQVSVLSSPEPPAIKPLV